MLGPLKSQNGWIIAQVAAVEPSSARPLEECRSEVVRALQGERTHHAIDDALARLESATKVAVADGARDAVAARIEQLRSGGQQGGTK